MASKTRSAETWMRGSCIRKDSIPATARSGCSEKRSFPSAARNSARRCPPAPAPTRSSANPYCTTCTGTPTGRTGRGRRRNGRRACRQHALCVLQAPSSRRRSTECGGPAPTRFQRTVACADTFTVHPEPHLSSGDAVANVADSPHVRTPAQTSGGHRFPRARVPHTRRAAGLLRRQRCGPVRAADAPPATRALSAAAVRSPGEISRYPLLALNARAGCILMVQCKQPTVNA